LIEIRPIRPEEKDEAKRLIPATCCEPDWANVWIVKDGDELKGIFGMESRLIVEPCYMAPHANGHALMTMTWIDGFLRAYAGQVGKNGYEFFVGDENRLFQNLLDRHFPVNGHEKPGKFYFRKFEV
jgi:hypothetical protein